MASYERLGGGGGDTSTNILNTGSVNSAEVSGSRVHYQVYKRRYHVLAVLCVLNVSNAMVST